MKITKGEAFNEDTTSMLSPRGHGILKLHEKKRRWEVLGSKHMHVPLATANTLFVGSLPPSLNSNQAIGHGNVKTSYGGNAKAKGKTKRREKDKGKGEKRSKNKKTNVLVMSKSLPVGDVSMVLVDYGGKDRGIAPPRPSLANWDMNSFFL